ncbi:MAG: CheC domain protein [Paenibacillaceae bacterium]|jgi:chemotaxis protein CheX|nr:CheC domain protein [Paenibacillaceae bacterium]
MNTELVNPFYKATREVFQLMLDLEIHRGVEQILNEGSSNKKAYVSIGIIGDLEGSILYCFPESMTLEMVRIMSGMEMETLDDFVASALSEIVNIISGNAVTDFSESHYACDILPPVIQVSEQPPEWNVISGRVLVLPIQTVIGPMRVEVDLRKKGA